LIIGKTDINERLKKKTCTDSFPIKKHILSQNEGTHLHGQYNSRVNECS